MRIKHYILFLLLGAFAAADTCHDIQKYDALQDVAMRWLADHDNPATLVCLARLSRNWQRPGYVSANRCWRMSLPAGTRVKLTERDPNDAVWQPFEYDRSEVTSSRQLQCLRDPNCVWEDEPEPEIQTLDSEIEDSQRLYPLFEIVYVPHTGKRYHTATCFWRGLTPREMTVLDALLAGRTPCLHCNPVRIKN